MRKHFSRATVLLMMLLAPSTNQLRHLQQNGQGHEDERRGSYLANRKDPQDLACQRRGLRWANRIQGGMEGEGPAHVKRPMPLSGPDRERNGRADTYINTGSHGHRRRIKEITMPGGLGSHVAETEYLRWESVARLCWQSSRNSFTKEVTMNPALIAVCFQIASKWAALYSQMATHGARSQLDRSCQRTRRVGCDDAEARRLRPSGSISPHFPIFSFDWPYYFLLTCLLQSVRYSWSFNQHSWGENMEDLISLLQFIINRLRGLLILDYTGNILYLFNRCSFANWFMYNVSDYHL